MKWLEECCIYRYFWRGFDPRVEIDLEDQWWTIKVMWRA